MIEIDLSKITRPEHFEACKTCRVADRMAQELKGVYLDAESTLKVTLDDARPQDVRVICSRRGKLGSYILGERITMTGKASIPVNTESGPKVLEGEREEVDVTRQCPGLKE